ncbi:LPXTG cell wall anchor domain-containing protein [Lactococcus petauri]|uniref:LPXTG cell wall anchor domain-containing protein n=3 Tax=Lactococcus petauri TaxID=1940789 RepID=UPI0020790988|nr:LPXTG cell wall anchor domain-containing protein [Lactococcus petauri]USI67068.1 LPXTG cell wall anchor domain-containing protein [Lactococcus petauri]WJE11787.1 LPXTG cell wall anchor domain-containing protein [Lactococcus petauri]
MKKTLIAGLILVTVSIGVQASADSINGYQVTLTDSNTAIGKNGLIWHNDGGTWYADDGSENGFIAPDKPEIPAIKTPKIPESTAEPIVPHKVLPEQKIPTKLLTVDTTDNIPGEVVNVPQHIEQLTPPNPNVGAHLDAPQHIEKAPKPIEQKIPEPITVIDPIEEPEIDANGSATIRIMEPKILDNSEIHNSIPTDTKQEIKKAKNDTRVATLTPKNQAVLTTLGTSMKNASIRTYQAKGIPLPATGEVDTITYAVLGISSITGSIFLALYLNRKRV